MRGEQIIMLQFVIDMLQNIALLGIGIAIGYLIVAIKKMNK